MTKDTAHDVAESFGYLTAKEVTALKQLAEMLPSNPIVLNIGAGAGTSGVAFLETRDDLTLYTIDIRQDSALGSLQSELNAIERCEMDVKHRHHQYLGDSKVMCQFLPKGVFSLAFVDGDHGREGVRGDLLAIQPLLTDEAIIAFDDYGDNEHDNTEWSEVTLAIDELMIPNHELILQADSVIAFRVIKGDDIQ